MTRVKLPFRVSRCRCVASGSAEAFRTQRHLEGDTFETLFRSVCVSDSPVHAGTAVSHSCSWERPRNQSPGTWLGNLVLATEA